MVAMPWFWISLVVPPYNLFPAAFCCCHSHLRIPLVLWEFSALGDTCRAGSSLGCQATDQWWNWSGAMYMSHSRDPKQTWGLQVKLTEHRHSCGKRKLRERETVSVSYDTLRCTHALSLAGLGVHVSSLSASMNAIILAQVNLNQNSIHCFFFPHPPNPKSRPPVEMSA